MRRMRLVVVPMLAAALVGAGCLALVHAASVADNGVSATPRDCTAGALVSAEPSVLFVGEEALVTSVITGTCYPFDMPIDITILVDQSNSMTKGEPGSILTPGAGETPGVDPTRGSIVNTPPGNVDPPDPGTPPPPKPTQDPGPLPTLLFGREAQSARPRGLSQIVVTPTVPPRVTPGPSPTFDPSLPPTRDVPTQPSNLDPTAQTIRRDQTEPAGDEDLIREVQVAVRDFLDEIEGEVKDGRYRVGLVAFNDRAIELVPLTDDVTRVRSRLTRVRGQGNTRVDLGLSAAVRQLVGVGIRGRDDLDHKKLVIIFSDGKYDRRTTARMRTRDEIDVVTVAVGRTADTATLRQIASDPQYALEVRDRKGLVTLTRTFKPNQRAVSMKAMTVEDIVATNMSLVPDSAQPPASRSPDARTMQWDFAPPAFPVTITYKVRPQEPGVHPVSEKAHATWEDSQKRNGDVPFPVVNLEVKALPTATATLVPSITPTGEIPPTATPTATPTSEPGVVFLPRLYKDPEPVPTKPCVPSEQTVDVALVMDTSTSMNEPSPGGGQSKIEAAVEAGTELVSLLKPKDQTAIIGFNVLPTLASALTVDKAASTAALHSLPGGQVQGTRIDLGLGAALEELSSSRHVAGNTRSIILLTDGRQVGGPGGNDAVRAVADQVKRAGITIVTVGIGGDVDSDLLREIASKPEYYFPAPNADDLVAIYREIAQFIPCP